MSFYLGLNNTKPPLDNEEGAAGDCDGHRPAGHRRQVLSGRLDRGSTTSHRARFPVAAKAMPGTSTIWKRPRHC